MDGGRNYSLAYIIEIATGKENAFHLSSRSVILIKVIVGFEIFRYLYVFHTAA
jgi:hypothetical protein